ncbi:MAG: hypothetical protein WKG00_12925 [Polyangiaceae bacterium]
MKAEAGAAIARYRWPVAKLTPDDLEAFVRDHPRGRPGFAEALAAIARQMPAMRGAVLEWFRGALADEERKWHAAWILRSQHVDARPLLRELLRAALREPNPSFNRTFVEPLRRPALFAEAVEVMLSEAELGGALERGGVGRVAYWLQLLPDSDEASWQRLRAWMLEEFVRASDVLVLRSLVTGVRVEPDAYPEGAGPLLEVAIAKARAHPDEWVRHCIARQLGESQGPFMALRTDKE